MSVESAPAGYRAAKESAAVFDLTGWTVLTLSGRDCVKFLHNFCTGDIKKLAEGEGCEAFFTNVKARVVGHGLVLANVDEEPYRPLTFIGTPGQGEKLFAHLDRYVITEDVVIHDITSESEVSYVMGPEAADRVQGLFAALPGAHQFRAALAGPFGDPREAGHFPWAYGRIYDRPSAFVRCDVFGLPGYLVLVSRELSGVVSNCLSKKGVAVGSIEAFEALRVEACFPLYGVDVTEDHLAPEVGRPWAISYTKGCYLGQEPIARIDALGHVNRVLCGMKLDSDSMPERGAAVVAEGKEIGTITSAALSYGDGRAVALGYLRAKFAEAGMRVTVRAAAGEVGAVVYRAPNAT